VHPRELSAVPLPRLASALENEGLLIDSVSPDLIPGPLPFRVVSALLVGAALLVVEYIVAATVLPVSILRAAHEAAASQAASATDAPAS
jgi:hypothetical protein